MVFAVFLLVQDFDLPTLSLEVWPVLYTCSPFYFEGIKGSKGWIGKCLWGQPGIGVSRLVGIDFGDETLSGDPGFAWMAFPVKLRVVPGDVAGWP